jgi:hypothetical protein
VAPAPAPQHWLYTVTRLMRRRTSLSKNCAITVCICMITCYRSKCGAGGGVRGGGGVRRQGQQAGHHARLHV